MARLLLQYLLPLILPTVAYALWLHWRRRRAAIIGARMPAWQEGRWFWPIIAGVALTAVVFVAAALWGGYAPDTRYEPARVINGQIVPGRFEAPKP
ncbi:MAG TPA: DUF6111 family protein [Alphaproteobacteria bacterium]|nr:DUF6111 family protein [Alphaproteobacteria bacterium]